MTVAQGYSSKLLMIAGDWKSCKCPSRGDTITAVGLRTPLPGSERQSEDKHENDVHHRALTLVMQKG